MARTSLERVSNPYNHKYEWDANARCHICKICGTAEHRSGHFYYAGKRSKIEPSCQTQI